MSRTGGLRRVATTPRPRYTGPTPATVAMVKARSGGRCEFPGCRRMAEVRHHRYERGMGGTDVEWVNNPSNLLDACHHHNDWASNQHPTVAFEMGWRVRRNDRPWLVPVQTRHHDLPVYLDDNGDWRPFDGAEVADDHRS